MDIHDIHESISTMECQKGHMNLDTGTPMHLYAQDFDERETFDNKLALHPSVLAVPGRLGWVEILKMGTWMIVGVFPLSDRVGLDPGPKWPNFMAYKWGLLTTY